MSEITQLARCCKAVVRLQILRLVLVKRRLEIVWVNVVGYAFLVGLFVLAFTHKGLFQKLKVFAATYFDPRRKMKSISPKDWSEVERDNYHLVVDATPLGKVSVVNVKHQTTFTINGVPAEFCRCGARF